MPPRALLFTLLPSLALSAEPPSPVDAVSQSAIQSAFRVLQRDYIRREDLSIDQMNRAALQGLLDRLAFGAEIVKEKPPGSAPKAEVIAEFLTKDIGYLRPVSLQEGETTLLEGRLKEFAEKGVKHVLLDLRSATEPGEFEVARAMLELFVPQGQLLFKLKQPGSQEAQLMLSQRDPVWAGSLVALVDDDTGNLGETIAAVLKREHRAIVVGQRTRGATVRYDTAPLDRGWLLRFARSEMLLPNDASLYRSGLEPDYPVAQDKQAKKDIFTRSKETSMKAFVFETPRPRYNEANLVAGKNPELDDYVRRSSGETLSYEQAPLQDRVVQRATDLLRTLDHLAESKLPRPAAKEGGRP